MCKLSRSDIIALTVLALAVFSVVTLALIGSATNTAGGRHHEAPTAQEDSSASSDAESVEPVYLGLFTPKDTYAQWIMAALSGVSTVLSGWAVYLLRATLAETRRAVRSSDDAVAVTRHLGSMQTRAYLCISEVVFSQVEEHIALSGKIFNAGQSPAIGVTHDNKMFNDAGTLFKAEWLNTPWGLGGKIDIAPGQHIYFRSMGPKIPKAEFIAAVVNGSRHFWVNGIVKYADVFDCERKIEFRFESVPGGTPGSVIAIASPEGNIST